MSCVLTRKMSPMYKWLVGTYTLHNSSSSPSFVCTYAHMFLLPNQSEHNIRHVTYVRIRFATCATPTCHWCTSLQLWSKILPCGHVDKMVGARWKGVETRSQLLFHIDALPLILLLVPVHSEFVHGFGIRFRFTSKVPQKGRHHSKSESGSHRIRFAPNPIRSDTLTCRTREEVMNPNAYSPTRGWRMMATSLNACVFWSEHRKQERVRVQGSGLGHEASNLGFRGFRVSGFQGFRDSSGSKAPGDMACEICLEAE